MQTCLRSDFFRGGALAFEPKNGLMLGRAELHKPRPKVVCLKKLTGCRLSARFDSLKRTLSNVFFPGDDLVLLPITIDEAIPCRRHKERPKLIDVRELVAAGAETPQQIRPHGLHDVKRVKLGTQAHGKQPADYFSQIRFILAKNFFGSLRITMRQLFQQGIQG